MATERTEAIQTAVNHFIESTDEVIAAYQKLWWLADDAGNIAIKEKAHEAAEKVRTLIADYGDRFKAINDTFKEVIIANEEQQELSADELSTRADELYTILSNVDFRTISADQNALEAIASSWRNSL